MLMSSSVFAAGLPNDPFYFGAGLVQTNLSINQENVVSLNGLSGQADFENDGHSLKLLVGVDLDEHLSFELGLVDLGSVSLSDGVTTQKFISAESIYLDSILRQAIGDDVNVFALLGVTSWEVTNEFDETSTAGTGLHYGLGFDVNIYGSNNRVMRVLWDRHEFDQIILDEADSVSISVLFKF